jgi:hypothetical protein
MDEPSQLITFFWTQKSHTLWKDRCAIIHDPVAGNLDKSSARTRQTAQNHVTMAHSCKLSAGASPIFHWRNAFNHEHVTSSLGPRQCSQSSVTALVRRRIIFVPYLFLYFGSARANHERNARHRDGNDHRPYRTSSNRHSTAIPRLTRNQPATTSTNIRRSRHYDIRTYFSATTAAVTTTHAMQVTTPTDNIISRFRALRNRLQPPRIQVTQATTEELHRQYLLSFTRPLQPIPATTNLAKYDFDDIANWEGPE